MPARPRRTVNATPGTRDEANHGKSPSQFMDEANEYIRQRRETGLGAMLTDVD